MVKSKRQRRRHRPSGRQGSRPVGERSGEFLLLLRIRSPSERNSTVSKQIAQHSTVTIPQHSTAQHNTAQHSTAQHSTAQHSTAQHGTVTIPQHSTGGMTQGRERERGGRESEREGEGERRERERKQREHTHACTHTQTERERQREGAGDTECYVRHRVGREGERVCVASVMAWRLCVDPPEGYERGV